jgi:hypothetical protein
VMSLDSDRGNIHRCSRICVGQSFTDVDGSTDFNKSH